ncbi:translocation protein S66 [Puccinia graminis f. sp. tritici]|uniref:Translocation protein S66 n=1 Tax=Puccinia graminis f. sp. tritici TaxID=56615 RepID=A0A5B0S389_PUCGR|nr:translocation protein S66 [Puccinia graminis f. sp. tritici]KAA1131523.1 translocation protein S66 [Puccinia graminis f. sp. tritici]
MALPLYVPFGYITFLVGLLWLFSRHYRSRALRRKPPPPWFPDPHTARDVYISLLSMDPPPSQSVLVAALLARAMTDVKRIMSLKEAKQAMTNLLQKGQVGDELWERLLMAEKELDVELSEVVAEAEEYSQGWGGAIFSIASEALQSTMSQEIYKDIPKQRTLKTAEIAAARAFAPNPGELRILGSKPAVPAAQATPKPASSTAPPSQAKLAMLENIRAAQAKLKSEQEKKPTTPPPASSSSSPPTGSKAHSPGSSRGDQSDSDNEGSTSLLKSGPPSASKKKKPKKKKKN